MSKASTYKTKSTCLWLQPQSTHSHSVKDTPSHVHKHHRFPSSEAPAASATCWQAQANNSITGRLSGSTLSLCSNSLLHSRARNSRLSNAALPLWAPQKLHCQCPAKSAHATRRLGRPGHQQTYACLPGHTATGCAALTGLMAATLACKGQPQHNTTWGASYTAARLT